MYAIFQHTYVCRANPNPANLKLVGLVRAKDIETAYERSQHSDDCDWRELFSAMQIMCETVRVRSTSVGDVIVQLDWQNHIVQAWEVAAVGFVAYAHAGILQYQLRAAYESA